MFISKCQPIRFALRTIATAGAVAICLLAQADVKTTSRISISFSMAPAKPIEMDMTSYYKNGIMRIDQADGNSYIMDSKKKTTYVVNRKDKTYSEMSMDALANGGGDMMKSMHLVMTGHLSPTNQRTTLAGKSARKYNIDLKISANIPSQNGQPSMGTMDGTMTGGFWTTTALHEHYSSEEMMGAYTQFFQGLSMFGGNNKKVLDEFTKIKGFPLSIDMTMKMNIKLNKGTPVPTGMPNGITMTMKNDVKTIQETTLDASLFQIPAGYTKTKNAQIPPSTGGGGA